MGVGLSGLHSRIRQIGQKRKVEMVVAVSQVADLDIVDQLPCLLFVKQQRRNGNKSCGLRRYAVAVIELRQRHCVEKRSHKVVNELDSALRSGDQDDSDQNDRDHQNTPNEESVGMVPYQTPNTVDPCGTLSNASVQGVAP